MSTPTFLNSRQYTREEIAKYEAVYGEDFVSPGGLAEARALIERLALRPGDRVLDTGCGLGGGAWLLAREFGASVTAIDRSRNRIEEARRRCLEYDLDDWVTVVHGDCVELDAEGEFDAVYSRDVFLHVHDKARLFAVLRCALASGRRFLVTDDCASAPRGVATSART